MIAHRVAEADIQPGDYFVVNMRFAAWVNAMAGWRVDHAGLYVGDGKVVEAWAPKARKRDVNEYANHSEYLWYSADLSQFLRGSLIVWAEDQVDRLTYDWAAAPGIVLKFWTGIDVSNWYAWDKSYACAAMVARGYQLIGKPLSGEAYPHLVIPNDLDFEWNGKGT